MSGRAIVAVLSGPRKGHKAAIEPGGRLRVGRTDRADLVFPHDAQMSAVHCEIAWDGSALRLSDLGSIKGTRRDGEPVTEALVEDGDLVGAGETVLAVYLEDGIAPRKRHRPTPEQAEVRAKALAELRREEGPLHAVLDAARDERILELCTRSVEGHASLYEGVQGEALGEVAPYLVALAPSSRLLERLIMEGWGEGWGIYLTWRGADRDLRRHLRRFLMVHDDETHRRMYFRFYDPSVLRRFWPTCSPLQQTELLGEIGGLVVEGERGEVLRFPGEAGPR
jgi:hypothetical protein